MPRLAVDIHVCLYAGFDEANTSDLAVDESLYAQDLVVTNAAGVVPARLGNGRLFDGTTYARAPSAAPFQNWHYGTIIVWATLDSVNQTGDLLRPIVALDGPGGGQPDNTAFLLAVANDGAFYFRYDNGAANPVVFRTAPGLVRVGRYNSFALVLDFVNAPDAGDFGNAVVTFYLNNQLAPWASVTAGGVPWGAFASVTPPTPLGANAVLTVGGSMKSASRWVGVIDELSIHDTARAKKPYLDAAYFLLTRALTFNRLSTLGTVRTIGSVEMGGGTRWWCYERDQSIYVVRENSLGLFEAETLLTTSGLTGQGALSPGGAEQPRLAYDPASDTLLVIFASAGKVYKVTATSSDPPSTQNMPTTADTVSIVKMHDQVEQFRASISDEPAGLLPSVGSNPPFIPSTFSTTPSFGIALESSLPYGYVVYRGAPGVLKEYARAQPATPGAPGVPAPVAQTVRPYAGFYYWVPVPDRVYGLQYWAAPLDRSGNVQRAGLVWIGQDFFGQVHEKVTALRYDMDQTQEELHQGVGDSFPTRYGLSTHPPLKFALGDSVTVTAGGDSPFYPRVSRASFDPLKFSCADSVTLTAAGAGYASAAVPGGKVVHA